MTTALKITGATRLYAIVGDPVAQVRSPEVFSQRFAADGVDAVLLPVHVPSEKFDAVMPALLAVANLDGLIVTVPFKARMFPFAARVGASARIIEAVNALRREADGSWTGDMFDGIGFVRAAELKGERLHGRQVLLFGAGGAGSAIACALAQAGVASIDISDPEADRVRRLVDRLRNAYPECRLAPARVGQENFDMIVNASPVGMRAGDGMPGPIAALASGTLVADVVISEAPTALVRHATRYGCPCITGRDMHAAQVETIMSFFAQRSTSST